MRGVVVIALVTGLVGGPATADRDRDRDRERGRRHKRAKKPKPGTVLSVEQLGWPAGTTVVELGDAAKVYTKAGGRGRRIGKIAAGTRLAFRAAVAGRSSCRVWLELDAPHTGWMCGAKAAPTDEPPLARVHPIDKPRKRDYADIRKKRPSYETIDDIVAGEPTGEIRGFVRITGASETVDGVRYTPTDHGYVESRFLARPDPSTFAGKDLAADPPPQWPFAWLVARDPDAKVVLYDAPPCDGGARASGRSSRRSGRRAGAMCGRAVETVDPRTVAPVIVEDDDHIQISLSPARWVRARDARVARIAAPPGGIRDDERWLDVDIDQQVLIAYDGRTPVYATLVSTGHRGGTPRGVYRITKKKARTTMTNPAGARLSWNVRDVPWAMSFRKNFAVHGVYWHDAFGRKKSHGCVNLAPADARWVYSWTLPAVPDGWIEVKAEDDAGTAIRLKSDRSPDPPWMDFEGAKLATASRAARRRRAR
jgi:lipoprotein-anchoring transpeptidase ErfK/SrfK